ncbi:MAG TPA: methyltransferase [Acidobacteriota bacterium]|nr:methyltransferase [Acidobacteriota bacterium]
MKPDYDVLDDIRRFQRSRVILTAAELDLFTRLDGAPMDAPSLARAIGAAERPLTRVLDCLVTYGLLEKADGRYRTAAPAAALSDRHPAPVRAMALHSAVMWRTWSHLTETVRTGESPARHTADDKDDHALAAFIGAMHAIGRRVADDVAAALDLSPYRRLLDVGGGSGVYTMAFLRRNPALTAVLFDLPRVIRMTAEWLRADGLLDRVTLAGGNFECDELPGGCDLALLSAIAHQNSPAENRALFAKVFRALEPGGTLLVRDHVMDASRTEPAAGAQFAINMLVSTAGGDTYTFAEYRRDLEAAGFVEVTWLRSGRERMDSLVSARKPAGAGKGGA